MDMCSWGYLQNMVLFYEHTIYSDVTPITHIAINHPTHMYKRIHMYGYNMHKDLCILLRLVHEG